MSMIYVVVLMYIKLFEEVDCVIFVYIEWFKKGYVDGFFFVFGCCIFCIGGVILVKCDSWEIL